MNLETLTRTGHALCHISAAMQGHPVGAILFWTASTDFMTAWSVTLEDIPGAPEHHAVALRSHGFGTLLPDTRSN